MTKQRDPASLLAGGTFGKRRVDRNYDLVLAGLLVLVVVLFVLPLPTPLLDLLIATNLAASLVLLIVAMYVPSASSLSTFPSLLLFTTLFRLALNIASTKLILLHANAGHIIDTFGRLIVGNNVVVGGVVFLIIAIVQFVVIAKGSERVAEVAARFALDAMPGKQMSIDADVRAGAMSSAEAQRRRRTLEQESALHGAMDGAMKFVKGDSVASIIVALVNILAGLAIGVLMKDMSPSDALHRYAILTVGDGMVSQIPSLLVSIAAGVVITRVDTGGKDTQLANQIARQVTAHPRALIIAGLALSSFLLVPGFPIWVFGLLSGGIVAVGLATRRAHEWRRTPTWISHRDEEAPYAVAAPLVVRLAPDLRAGLDRHALDQRLILAKEGLEGELGPVFPRLRIEYASDVAPFGYEILVEDVPVSRGALRPGWQLIDPAQAASFPLGAEVAEPFGPFARVAWVRGALPGTATWMCEEVVGHHVDRVVRRHVPELIGIQDVQRLLRTVQAESPDLAAEVGRAVPAQRIAEVFRRLLQEGIPVRNLRAIFESLALRGPAESDAIALTELVRIDLGRYITSRYAGPARRVEAILFESGLLDRMLAAIERSARGNLLLLSPAVMQDVREQVRRILGTTAGAVVAIVSSDARRYVKTLIEPVAPDMPVLSYQELDADVALHPIGWVTDPKAA